MTATDTPPPRLKPLGLLVFGIAIVVFGAGIASEPHFVDESAYIAQSFYADLLLEGRRDDPAWLDYAGYDLPPLPKYLIGVALRLGGHARPGPIATAAWYADTSRRFVPDAALTVARVPSMILGAVGCVAIYAIGRRAFGIPSGLIAAGLLMASPLYRIHARRAMSDVPAEAFLIVAMAVGLAAWSRCVAGKGGGRAWILMVVGAGGAVGLSVLSKLNGAIAGMVLGAWGVLALVLPRVRIADKLAIIAATSLSGVVAFGLFVALNPFLTAHPSPTPARPDIATMASKSLGERAAVVAQHRAAVSGRAMELFPHNALPTVAAKIKAVAVQGFGRFSPIGPTHSDSTVRFDWSQDAGAIIWWPTVLAGFIVAIVRGRRQLGAGEPPTAWAVVVASLVAVVVVASFIPLAWDRYFLSIQPGAILLASAGLGALVDRIAASRRTEPIPS